MAANHARQQKIIPSTLPNQKALCLPPLDATPCKEGVPAPVVYTVRLPDEVAKALVASTDATVTFEAETEGLISIPGLRNVPFKARPVTDVNNETARATCFSRRGSNIRTIGPILADMELVENRPPNYNPKKRALETTVQKRPELKPLNEVPEPTPPGKRQRMRKQAPEKRPRPAPRRPALTSQPAPKISSQPASAFPPRPLITSKPIPTNSVITPSVPSSPPSRPTAQNGADASRLPLRSAPASSHRSPLSPNISPFKKPHTSAAPPPYLRSAPIPQSSASAAPHPKLPAPSSTYTGPNSSLVPPPVQSSLTAMPSRRPVPPNVGNGQHNLHSSTGLLPSGPHGVAKRRTPTGSSLTAMRNRNVSPPMAASSLPHPAVRRGHGNHYSPYTSRASSPRPGNKFYGYNGSPASPRVPPMARPDQRAELRRHVVHMLAAGDCTIESLRSRLKFDNTSSMGPVLSGVLKEVADRQSGLFSLRQGLWGDVSLDYAGYTDIERSKTKMRRSTLAGPNFEGATTNAEGMTDAQLDERISEFEKVEKQRSVDRPNNSSEEAELRQRFQTWYATYRVIIGRMEEMRRTFERLEERYTNCQKAKDKTALVQQIRRSHDRLQERKKRFESALPALHAMLKNIREALRGRLGKPSE